MMHQSTRRFAPPVRRLRVGRHFTSRTFHLTLRCQRKGAMINLGKKLAAPFQPDPLKLEESVQAVPL